MRRLLLTLTALALVLAGCGDDDDAADAAEDATETTDGVTETTAGDDGDAGAVDDDAAADDGTAVTVTDFAFDPATVEVAVGGSVTWTNEDGVPHTATAGAPGEASGDFDERLDASGGSATATFDTAGTYDYFCAIHPAMTGQVVVS